MYNMLCVSNIEVSSSNATERTYTISASQTSSIRVMPNESGTRE